MGGTVGRGDQRRARALAGVVALVVLLALVASVPVAVGQEQGTVVGRPELELSVQDNRLTWGDQTLQVSVSNSGVLVQGGPPEFEDRVQTARNLRLEVAEDRLPDELVGNFRVESGPVLAGVVPPGVAGPFAFAVEVDESLAPGTYEIPIRVQYEYTRAVEYGPGREPELAESSRDVVETVTVVVEDRARFELDAPSAESVAAGDTGTVAVTVRNTGTQTATNARVVLTTANSSLFFGDVESPQQVQTVFVGRLDPGEERTVAVAVGASRTTPPGVYPVRAVVAYEGPNGEVRQSDPLSAGVAVGGEQTFAVRSVNDTLQAGGTGNVSGVVVNTGGATAREVVVEYVPEESELAARNVEYAVGTLAPGEAAAFSFRVDATNRSEPGPRDVTFRVRYRNPDGERRVSQPVDARVTVGGEQTFAVRDVASTLQVDAAGRVTGTVVNAGGATARDAVVVLQTPGGELQPRTTEYAVGTLEPGEAAAFSFRVDATNRSEPGPRQLSAVVRYRDADGDRRTSEPVPVRVTVSPEPAFEVRSVATSLRVGQTGVVRGTVVNTGDEPVRDAVVVLGGASPSLRPRETEFAVGTLAPGEARSFSFRVDVTNDSAPGPRTLTFRVRYRDAADERRTSAALDSQVAVRPEQTFAVRNVTSTLRPGDAGTVRGVVANTGNATVRDAVVVYRSANPNLAPRETEYAVGDLQPGESAAFEFTVDVNAEADPGPRQATFGVRYRDPGDDTRQSERLDARVVVGAERDEFRVEAVNATVERGGSEVVAFRVTNAVDAAVSDVEVKLFADDPLASADDEAYVSRLQPGESTVVRFEVSAAGSALPKAYPATLDFSYEDAAGDRELSEPYRVPVRVVEPEARSPLGGLPAAALVPVALVVVAAALIYWRRDAVRRRLR